MKPSVLVTRKIYPEAVEYLRQHCDVDYVDSDDGLPAEDLVARARAKQGIVAQLTDRFSAAVIDKLEAVRVIANVAVGYDNIDLEAAARRGILVTNTPDVLTETTADLAFALLLATARRLVEGHQLVHAGRWQRWSIDFMVGQDVHHRTLGIIGFGRIGQAVARRAQGFSMRILYYDPFPLAADVGRESGAEATGLDQLLAESDFVSLHVPLSDETHHLIGEKALRRMKRTAVLVNTARGRVVDEAALVRAVSEGWIGGAGLDVFEREPEVHPGLLGRNNVVVTPHIGSASVDTRRKMSMRAAENAVAALSGRRPPNLVSFAPPTKGIIP